MEHKILEAVGFKLRDDTEYPHGIIEGYASTFGNVDSVGERVERGAFTKHLPNFLKNGFIAFNHQWEKLPIAMPIEAYEDEIGLFVRGAFHSTPEAQAARTVVRERMDFGKAVRNSIGYQVHKDGRDDESRLLKEIELFEWSVVNVPANPLASLTGAKSGVVSTLGLNEHISEVVSALDVLAGRVRERHDFRTKEGRVLSSANRTRIEDLLPSLMSVHDALKDLLNATAPKTEEEKGWAETHKLYADALTVQQRIRERLIAAGVTP